MLLAEDLALMQETQQAAMMDTGDVLTYTPGDINSYGKQEPATYVSSGIPTECGIGYIASTSSREASGEVPTIRTVVRLPLDTTVTGKDRLQVQERFGVAITPITYGILGEIRRGPSCLSCDVFLITDGSDE